MKVRQTEGDSSFHLSTQQVTMIWPLNVAELHCNKICRSTIRYLLDDSDHAWRKCVHSSKNSITPLHGNENMRAGNGKAFDVLICEDLDEYFEIMESLSEPQSTRVVRHVT